MFVVDFEGAVFVLSDQPVHFYATFGALCLKARLQSDFFAFTVDMVDFARDKQCFDLVLLYGDL